MMASPVCKAECDVARPVVQRDFEPKIAANDEKGSQGATFETLDGTFRPKDPEKQEVQSQTQLCKAKEALRKKYEKIRSGLDNHRRFSAERALFAQLCKLQGLVLSFSSFRSEISTRCLHVYLAERGQLLLPRVEGGEIVIYKVDDIERQLRANKWGLQEPNPEMCVLVSAQEVEVALVPALAFDARGYRIGYGGGYYDRLLPQMTHCVKLGVGFKEQLATELPLEPHDIPLSQLLLL